MDKIQIVRHSPICITGTKIGLKLTYFFKRECFDRLIIRAEDFLHLLIHILLVYRKKSGLQLLGNHLSILYLEGNGTEADVPAMAS